MIVMKFGGSSVANAERIRGVTEIVKSQAGLPPVVVLSAMGDTTDHLLEAGERALREGPISVEESMVRINETHLMASAGLGLGSSMPDSLRPLLEELGELLAGVSLIRELTERTRDYLVSFGERLSVRLASLYFIKAGINARPVDAFDAGFLSDSRFTSAELLPSAWEAIPAAIKPLVEQGVVPVVTGFIAKDRQGHITTLGRGGSDLSATMIAASCGAAEVQVWKDVDGILTADPRLVPAARPVERVTYEEAAELAYFGAQVLHPRAMQPCQRTGTPVRVKNSYNPSAPGTVVGAKVDESARPVRALTSRTRVTLVDIVSSRMVGQPGFLAEVFACFARHKVSVDIVATSEVSVSLTLDADYDIAAVVEELEKVALVTVHTNRAIVSIICDTRKSGAILRQAFGAAERLGVRVQMISQGASKVNVSLIVNDAEAAPLVVSLHKEFFE